MEHQITAICIILEVDISIRWDGGTCSIPLDSTPTESSHFAMRWRSDKVEAPAGALEISDEAGPPSALDDSFSGSDMVEALYLTHRQGIAKRL
jgi:hypothetical protein